MISPRASGLTLALVSAFAFGGSGPAAKPLITAGLSPLHVTWLRVAGAALVMLPLAIRYRGVARRRPGLLLAYGLFPVAGVQACYFAAVSRIPVGVALLIEYLAPVLVLGWVRFVRRHPVPPAAGIGVVLAVAGLAGVVQVWQGLRFDAIGLLLALAAAGCQVCYFLLSDTGARPVRPLAVISHGLVVGAVVLTVIARPWTLPWRVLGGDVAVGTREWPALGLVAWIALITTVLAYATGVLAVRRLSPQVAGAVACLEAVLAAVLAWVLLGEHLTVLQVAGGVVVLAGAFLAQTATPAPASPPPEPLPDPGPSRSVPNPESH